MTQSPPVLSMAVISTLGHRVDTTLLTARHPYSARVFSASSPFPRLRPLGSAPCPLMLTLLGPEVTVLTNRNHRRARDSLSPGAAQRRGVCRAHHLHSALLSPPGLPLCPSDPSVYPAQKFSLLFLFLIMLFTLRSLQIHVRL